MKNSLGNGRRERGREEREREKEGGEGEREEGRRGRVIHMIFGLCHFLLLLDFTVTISRCFEEHILSWSGGQEVLKKCQ